MAYKTTCVFFPPLGHFKPPALPPPTSLIDPSHLPVTSKFKQESEEQKRKYHDILYNVAPETMLINIGDRNHITLMTTAPTPSKTTTTSLRDYHRRPQQCGPSAISGPIPLLTTSVST